jgi:uncharacterized membrane protein YeaQ/YmgE (transglycosylase-associated protein family)
MGICGWIVFGFLAGLVARALMPGTQKMGFILTTLLGVGGAFAGGFIQSLLFGGNYRELRPIGFVGAVIGAFVLLLIGELMGGRKQR